MARGLLGATIVLAMALALQILILPGVAQDRLGHDAGEFEWRSSPDGILITAPHGTYDRNTATIAIGVARHLGTGYVIFRGRPVADRVNVNRPTEGAGRTCREESQTDTARSVYDTYVLMVRATAGPNPLSLYVEVHGQAAPQRTALIDVATKGIGSAEAAGLKGRFAGSLTAIQRAWPGYPVLILLVEPIDRIAYTASCTRAIGILGLDVIPRALHFEFPASAREETWIDATAALTADLLRGLTSPPR